jgi:hypothetical protein
MFHILFMPRHWGPAHDGEPGRWGVIGPRVGEDVFLHSRTPWCPRQSTTALFPRGGLKLHGAATRNIHERGLTETKWADQPIGVSAVKRYTSDSNLSRINVRSSAHAVPTLRGSQRETGNGMAAPKEADMCLIKPQLPWSATGAFARWGREWLCAAGWTLA